jgi:hypothetical protein
MSDTKTELPSPERREVHRDVRQSASYETFSTQVVELEHKDFLFFCCHAEPPAFHFVATDDMAARVQQKIESGWALLSMTRDSATLVHKQAEPPHGI